MIQLSGPLLLPVLLLLLQAHLPHAQAAAGPTINRADYSRAQIIQRDVAIIGGGSSGCYSAIALQDANASVIVIERESRLGGHAETYRDPASGATVDIGVALFHPVDLVRRYFARFSQPLTDNVVPQFAVYRTVDFDTGYTEPASAAADPSAALAAYAAQLAQYDAYIRNGFDLPDPVPARLLQPFAAFVADHQLEPAMALIATIAQGLPDLATIPTLYVLKAFGADVLAAFTSGALLTTAAHNIAALYDAIATHLASSHSVLLSARVLAISRAPARLRAGSPHLIAVTTPAGPRLIIAKRLLITAPPTAATLAPLDTDSTEAALLAKFRGRAYWTGILANTGLPSNTSVTNVAHPPVLSPLPRFPGIYGLVPTSVAGLVDVKFATNDATMTAAAVQRKVLADVGRVMGRTMTAADVRVLKGHAPFEMTVSADEIGAGFYRQLYALQGRTGTWWAGAAWHTHDSTLLWKFCGERIVPDIVQSLRA